MSANKQIRVNKLVVDESTGQVKTEQTTAQINQPVNISQYNVPDSAGLSTINTNISDGAWYILYWLDQYEYLPDQVKTSVQQTLTDSPYLDNFSESIAALIDAEHVKDNSTVPVSDIGADITGYTYARVLDYVLTRQTASLTHEMSVKTNNMFKKNMTFIKDSTGVPSKLSTDTHARNLITDSQHHERLVAVLDDLEQMIQEKMNHMYDVLKFIQHNTSAVEFSDWKQRIMIENNVQLVDNNQNIITHKDNAASNNTLQSSDLKITV